MNDVGKVYHSIFCGRFAEWLFEGRSVAVDDAREDQIHLLVGGPLRPKQLFQGRYTELRP